MAEESLKLSLQVNSDEFQKKINEMKKGFLDAVSEMKSAAADVTGGKSEKKTLEELLSGYLDYSKKRLQLEKQFNDELTVLQEGRKKALENGDMAKVGEIDFAIAKATQNSGKSLINLDFEQLKSTPEYVRAFENLHEVSGSVLTSLLNQLEDTKLAAMQAFDPELMKGCTAAIQAVYTELSGRNPFKTWIDDIKELKAAQEELKLAEQNYNNAKSEVENVQKNKTASSSFNSETGKIEYSKSALNEEGQAMDNLTKATEKLNAAKDKVVEKNSRVEESEKKVTSAVDKVFKNLSAVGNELSKTSDATTKFIGEILSIVGTIGSTVLATIDGINAAGTAGSAAISAVEKASVILAAVSVAFQLFSKISGLFGRKAHELSKEQIRQYESLASAMDKVTERHQAMMKELTGAEAVGEYNKSVELMENKITSTQEIGVDYVLSNAKRSRSYGSKMRSNLKSHSDELASIGIDFDALGPRIENIFSLPVEQLKLLQETDAWNVLDEKTQQYIQTIIDSDEKLEEFRDNLNETLTGIDYDSFRDGFMSTLLDMNSTSEDFAKSFESNLQKAILNSLMVSKYNDRIKNLYEKWAEYSKDGLTEREVEELRAEQNKLAEDMIADRESLKVTFGWGTDAASSSQSSSSVGVQSMSQESADELNGRFTALQMIGEEMKALFYQQAPLLENMDSNMNTVKFYTQEISTGITEMKDIALTSMNHLAAIEKNTKELYSVNERLGKIEKNTSRL